MGIYGMALTIAWPTTLTIAITMVLIAIALVSMTLTLGLSILSIWVSLALVCKMARLATIVAFGS